MRRATGLLTLTVAVFAAAPAAAETRTFAIAKAVQRADCALQRVQGAGTQTLTYTAPVTGALTFALHGGDASDWDLTVFDRASGRRLAGAGAWGADEVAQVIASAGQQLDVQACRVSGRTRALTLDVATAKLPKPQTGGQPVRQSLIHIKTRSASERKLVGSLGLDLGHDETRSGVSAVIRDARELDVLRKLGITFETKIADLAVQDRKDRAADAVYAAKMRQAGGSALPTGRTTYRQLEDYYAELKKLAQEHPAIVRPVTLPKKSFQGREQTGVEISSNVYATDDQKPVSFIMGMHHAREWPAAEVPLEFAYYLVQGYGTDKVITDFLNRTRVVIVPLINPDGFLASRTSFSIADTLDPTGVFKTVEGVGLGGILAYRRKNCRGASPSPATPCILQYGVDPNRNYGFNWGGLGASTDPTAQTYRGPSPWSESETQSVHEYSQVRDVTTLLTIHNVAALVLRPPGTSAEGTAPDEPALKALGDAMGADTGYTSQYGYQLYDTSGTTEDWNYGAAGTFGYTIEIGPEGGDFHMPYQVGVVDEWTGTGNHKGKGLRQALLRMVEAATDAKQFSTLAGRAAPGRTLRIKRTFKTSTSRVCTIAQLLPISLPDPIGGATDCIAPTDPILIDDKLEYTTKVPANGNFSWLVTPSSAPFMHKAGKDTEWTLTCEDDAGTVYETKQVKIWRGETQTFTLPCGGKLVPLGGAPRSRITRKSLRATRRGLQLAGTSVDAARVEVAVGRRVGSRCRFVRRNGSFTQARRCTSGVFMRASGKATWTLVIKRRLPAGRYIVWARGVDAAGKHERRHNPVAFRIR
jgi:hypothetical protein